MDNDPVDDNNIQRTEITDRIFQTNHNCRISFSNSIGFN